MKNIMRNKRGRFAAMFTVVMAAFTLAACGGGGGGSDPTPIPTSVTVTCPNGTSSTAGTTALANANCPLPKVLTISPVDKATGVAVGFTQVTVTTDSTLDATSINGVNFNVLAPGPTTVAGTVSADGTKGFKWVPTAVLSPAQVYTTLWVGVKDTLGRAMTGSSMFTMASISCVAPQVPSTDGMTCVTPPPPWWPPATITPIGVKVFGANLLPAGCDHWTQDCWHTAVTDGTVKFIATSVLTPVYANRPLIFAYYRHNSTAFGTTGLWQFLIMYTDDGSPAGFDIAGGSASEVDWVYGTSTGIIWHDKSLNICGNFAFDVSIGSFANRSPVVCP